MKGMCSVCGTSDIKIIRHHTDYENGVTVRMCLSCHQKLHKRLEKNGMPLNVPIGFVRPRIDTNENHFTCVQVSLGTHAKLCNIGKYGETFNHIVERLLDAHDVSK